MTTEKDVFEGFEDITLGNYPGKEGVQRYAREKIKKLLDKQSIKRRDLAFFLDSSADKVNRILDGKETMDLDFISETACALGVSFNILLPIRKNIPKQNYFAAFEKLTGRKVSGDIGTVKPYLAREMLYRGFPLV